MDADDVTAIKYVAVLGTVAVLALTQQINADLAVGLLIGLLANKVDITRTEKKIKGYLGC